MEIIEELVKAVSEDINKIRLGEQDETGIYRYAFSCNPKPYPISGFQHFFGTAFIAARLAEFSGLSDDDQVTNFLIGLIHDYEKMGLDLNRLEGDVYELLGETRLANVVDKYCDRWKDAIEVASKLESGGIPRNLQRMAEFVRLGDYLTGGEESWNIAYVMDMVKSVLDKIFVKHHLVPIVVGKQRPVIAMVAEKLEDEIRGLNLIPLVSMPTGLLVLSKDPIDVKISNRLYEALTEYIINMPSAVAGTASKETKRTRINLDIVKNIIDTSKVLMQTRDEKERDSARKRLSSLLGRVGTLYKLSSADLASAKVVFQSPEDKRRLVIYLVISLARTLYSQANEKTLRAILDELEVKVAEGNIERMLAQLYDNLGDSEERVNELLESLLDKARRCMAGTASGKDVEESIANVLKRTIGIGFMETTPSIDGDSCFRCRERIKRGGARTLYEQLQVEQRATKTAYADVFHPDKQGKPESLSSMNESSKRMIVCPVCFFEAKVFTEVTGFTDGMWASNIIYYPAISVDLLRVFRSVAGHYSVLGIMREKWSKDVKPLVIPDYVSSRIIVKTSDDYGRLRKHDLLMALNLWYYIGGNLILTTNALSAPPPWSGLPIEMEASDVVIEESVSQFMEELRIAKEKSRWTRTRLLRKILYEQLRTYILNLEEAERKMGRTRFLKSGLVVSNAPSLDVYSFLLRRHV